MPVSIKLIQSSPTSMQLDHSDFEIKVDRPIKQGGGGSGLMGGQYLLVGIAGCFCSTLFAAAQAREIKIEGLKVTLRAELSVEAPKRFTDISLDVTKDFCSHPEEFKKLLAIAEKGCISVNTVKREVGISVFSK